LLDNAVQSIQLGVEDFQSNDVRRPISAIRNFFAGVLLLAKQVLLNSVPNADPEDILFQRYEPVPDGNGGVTHSPKGKATLDFPTIIDRFKAFSIPFNEKAMRNLSPIRNDIEHYFTDLTPDAVRDAIASAFPCVVELFSLMGMEPSEALGPTWQIMLDVRAVYEQELRTCEHSFASMDWQSNWLSEADRACPHCGSVLVYQGDPNNTELQSAEIGCRACGKSTTAEKFVEHIISESLGAEAYIAVKDGGEAPYDTCPECGVEAYVMLEDEEGCLWCREVLGNCRFCDTKLVPSDTSCDDSTLCSYCAYKLDRIERE
jgi:hypothetical protein